MKLFTPSLMILAMFVLGGAIFKMTTPNHCTTIMPYENIFVLTGDPRRIPVGIKIIKKNPTAKLFIIGVGAPDIKKFAPQPVRHQVITEGKSKTTAENAIAIREIAIRQNMDRIVLLTTQDHFNRAALLVSRKLPNIEIAACPVPLHGLTVSRRLERWLTEYLKYIATLAGFTQSK